MDDSPFKTEEDVRTKLVIPWLIGHGFSVSELHLEFAFRIRLGKSTIEVRDGATLSESSGRRPSKSHTAYSGRADVLVQNAQGHNLLVVEVKARNEPLDEQARDQGISYARLAEGNIAPFVVLTNGKDTRVFDSHTRQEIFDLDFSFPSACARQVFRTSADELSLRAEALEAFISFSPSNLIAHCSTQSLFRMRPLCGEDIDSDKKYIPSLFIERTEASEALKDFLDIKKARVTLLIGQPQVGKTNFICHSVLTRLADEQPCMFYPAISLRNSLLEEIASDFEWSFSGTSHAYGHLARRINSVLQRTGKRLTIFIDGWNEANIELARAIDADCSRLTGSHIQIVISMTNTSASRLLNGPAGNPSFLADEAGVQSQGAALMELDPEAAAKTQGWNCIHLRNYSSEEQSRAYSTYAAAYQVTISDLHQKTLDPYILGIAMKQHRGTKLPDSLDEPKLLESFLRKKITRAIGLDHFNVPICLRELGKEMLRNGAPVPVDDLNRILALPMTYALPQGLFDAALLTRETGERGAPAVDFYYGRERDFTIACISQDWPSSLAANADMDAEFSASTRTTAGTEALRWFFKQPAHISLLKNQAGGIPIYSNSEVRRTLLEAFCEHLLLQKDRDDAIFRFAMSRASEDNDFRVRLTAVKCVAMITDDPEELLSALSGKASLHELLEAIVGIGEEFPLDTGNAGQVVLDAVRSMHWESCSNDEYSDVTNALEKLMQHSNPKVRREASSCYGYASPGGFLQHLSRQMVCESSLVHRGNQDEFAIGIELAADSLREAYYGGMCPGSLEAICEDYDSQLAEYNKMARCLLPVIQTFGSADGIDIFKSILSDLAMDLKDGDERSFVDIYTRPLPF